MSKSLIGLIRSCIESDFGSNLKWEERAKSRSHIIILTWGRFLQEWLNSVDMINRDRKLHSFIIRHLTRKISVSKRFLKSNDVVSQSFILVLLKISRKRCQNVLALHRLDPFLLINSGVLFIINYISVNSHLPAKS